jgi:hypothetical protein
MDVLKWAEEGKIGLVSDGIPIQYTSIGIADSIFQFHQSQR